MKCPSCGKSELIRVELGERDPAAVDRCPSCHGCWLNVAELNRMHLGVWSNLDELRLTNADTFSDRLCPKCAAQMLTANPDDHKSLAVERCPTCHGLWLDNGELSQLHDIAVQHVAEHGALHQRPDGWSPVRWVAYRVAEQWKHLREH